MVAFKSSLQLIIVLEKEGFVWIIFFRNTFCKLKDIVC